MDKSMIETTTDKAEGEAHGNCTCTDEPVIGADCTRCSDLAMSDNIDQPCPLAPGGEGHKFVRDEGIAKPFWDKLVQLKLKQGTEISEVQQLVMDAKDKNSELDTSYALQMSRLQTARDSQIGAVLTSYDQTMEQLRGEHEESKMDMKDFLETAVNFRVKRDTSTDC